jgi:hypothetical protein
MSANDVRSLYRGKNIAGKFRGSCMYVRNGSVFSLVLHIANHTSKRTTESHKTPKGETQERYTHTHTPVLYMPVHSGKSTLPQQTPQTAVPQRSSRTGTTSVLQHTPIAMRTCRATSGGRPPCCEPWRARRGCWRPDPATREAPHAPPATPLTLQLRLGLGAQTIIAQQSNTGAHNTGSSTPSLSLSKQSNVKRRNSGCDIAEMRTTMYTNSLKSRRCFAASSATAQRQNPSQ